jgi:hypothetical protein
MRDRSLILVAGLLVILFLGVGGLYAFDQARKDTIAEGVRVGGVEVGGLDRLEARDKIISEMRARQRLPIVVRDGRSRFRMTPQQAAVEYDVNAMVDAAIARSREGSIFQRTWRDLRGTALNENVPAEVTFSRLVVTRFVDRIERRLNRKPQNAHLVVDGGSLRKVPGKRGVRIDSRGLQNRLIAAITGLTAANIRVRAVKTQPKIKMADLEERYPTVLVIDRPGFKLRLYRRLRHVRTYGIAIGQAGYDTPAGEYSITDKAVNPNWYVPNAAWTGSLAGQVIPGGAANNPLKSRWLGFGEGRGIHGTAETGSIGTAASHGCIRMLIPEVEELYPRVPVGAPLFVV